MIGDATSADMDEVTNTNLAADCASAVVMPISFPAIVPHRTRNVPIITRSALATNADA